jgi:hypothetical protein
MRYFLLILALLVSSLMFGQDKKQSLMRDTLDNKLDISQYLYGLTGFLPVLAPITEPAVGYGAAGALLYFVPTRAYDSTKFQIPDIAGLLGGYTENNTWLAGGFYAGFWNEDRIRYQGIIGYADAKLKFYGNNSALPGNIGIDFNLQALFIRQQALWRLGNSKFFLGGNYQFARSKVPLFDGINIPGVEIPDFELTSSGITLIGEYENLNGLLSPTKGYLVHLDYIQNMEFLGSDRNFGTLTLYSYLYLPVSSFWVPAIRFEGQMATGNPPFYGLPFVTLRGVPAMRYQGNFTALIETEQLFNLNKRWSLVGFAGSGLAFKSIDNPDKESQFAWNAGGGFRYLLARLLGLRSGIDIARGPEQWAIYVVFGKSWR